MSESNEKNEDKTAEISKLTAKIDKMAARSAQLKDEVAGLNKALAALVKAGAEMTQMREQEQKDYVQNKADMEQGLEGVKLALRVLREYYAQDKAHAANEGGGASVIGLLEVVESDFTKGLAEMTATEESAQSAFEAQTKENEIEQT